MKKLIILALIIFSFVFIPNNAYAARKKHLDVSIEEIPQNTYYVDILVKLDINNKNYKRVDRTIGKINDFSEIVNYYDDEGFVSLTFNYSYQYDVDNLVRCYFITTSKETKEELPEDYLNDISYSQKKYYWLAYYNTERYNQLKNNLIDVVDMEYNLFLSSDDVKDLKDFKYFKLAFIDENGNVLKTSNSVKLRSFGFYNYKFDGTTITRKANSIYTIAGIMFKIFFIGMIFAFFATNILFVFNMVLYNKKKNYPDFDKYMGIKRRVLVVITLLFLAFFSLSFIALIVNFIYLLKIVSIKKPNDNFTDYDNRNALSLN